MGLLKISEPRILGIDMSSNEDTMVYLVGTRALKVSDTYILGVDITQEDESVVSVSKRDGKGLEYVNTIVGKDAEALVELLLNKNMEGGK